MTDETKRIIEKLPNPLRQEFAKDYAINPKYSHKWEAWALDVVEQLNKVRDEGYITPEERNVIFDDIFDGYIMGKVGENPQTNWKKFWEMFFYEEAE